MTLPLWITLSGCSSVSVSMKVSLPRWRYRFRFCIRSSSVSLRALTMPDEVKVLMKSLPTPCRRTAFSLAILPERKCM